MIHLRIVAPEEVAHQALEVLGSSPAVLNIVHLHGAAQKPAGDVILCDVAKEEASVILGDLKELEIPRVGSISLEHIDTQISDAADRAEQFAPGAPSDAVVWEQVETSTSENVELSGNFIAFMVLAVLIATAGIFLDSPILIIGAMVVGPEFGPLAGLCVAMVERRRDVAVRSLAALTAGFPVGITAAFLFTLICVATGLVDPDFKSIQNPLTRFIADPDTFSFIVAAFAGAAGMLSLTSAKSGALVGVLISVTTIPAAANIGVAAALGNWEDWRGAMLQLSVNLTAIVLAGVTTLFVQRLLFERRRRRHLAEVERA